MIPAIRTTSPLQSHYLDFIEALKAEGFAGELNPDYANRTVLSTDNSIYQVLPQGVVYPRHSEDLLLITALAAKPRFRNIVLSPRGGGTGTNGQSLTDGLVVDTSRHMNQILEINVQERWVRVQAGVVKDQLNAALTPHGLFFAPELSTSNRATIGGMINTDASGQGSCEYGKTRDHVLALESIWLDGSQWGSKPLNEHELDAVCGRQDRIGEAHRVLRDIAKHYDADIKAKFPPLNRCLTGYDLAHIYNREQQFDLNSILCGAEGTLAFITEAKLNLLPIPKHTALVTVLYQNFDAALRDATELMKAKPTSIETIDSRVFELAKNDIVWHSVSEFFPAADEQVAGINLVEYSADTETELAEKISRLTSALAAVKGLNKKNCGFSVVNGRANVNKIWAMRKKSVGLLGNVNGEARPIPFVEDTCVPPENLADFIAEFRALLDQHQLQYGMFGHVDAGVLHVRPIIDMKDPEQIKTVRHITDCVVSLVQKYNGLLWGEHGKGLRSEYAPAFFGDLYPQLQRIKGVFDPHNQFNPGKIATPSADIALTKIDEPTTRGDEDRKIPVQVWQGYSEGMHCNGNGACYNWNPNDAMCPSWKVTRERVHSPKGRASLIREWLKQLAERDVDPIATAKNSRNKSFLASLPARIKNTLNKDYDFSHEVMDSMSGCLACKSCVGQCPVKVDVPEFRSKFLELYHSRYLRPLKDYFVGGLEFMMPAMVKVPWLYNGLMKFAPVKYLLKHVAGMVDSPLLTGTSIEKTLNDMGILWATPTNLLCLTDAERAKTVAIVQDAFISFFETQVLIDNLKLLRQLGFTPMLVPFMANGKPLHVHGFRAGFERAAQKNSAMLNALKQTGVPLVGLEPSMTLAYRAEYVKVMGADAPKVELIQEWLAKADWTQTTDTPKAFKLLAHCTEKTNAAASIKDWLTVFTRAGHSLSVIEVGCCGMAGTYGHETRNRENSEKLFDLSWRNPVTENAPEILLATGFSCRSQTERLASIKLKHPVQALLQV
ncbi:FAD-binding and (Fe-S)-binding domain-containing protein [Simiduia curdlanivorans]|uniref:FAD-binding and (Fe-S)-binding domain-containing protein n=1 Tax=Simiduia curdlanivorans TaxID=1492769 RepID=A0ABV8V1F1_9GAMM|nr:FAD-binding and (Fe-S)-binding domain-containing protein [Simiduia curdlanivorans]MDN3639224.1 FAD-binding and (Fe-S)-binding domain-containing protein [Simiduia curdlanivorans]